VRQWSAPPRESLNNAIQSENTDCRCLAWPNPVPLSLSALSTATLSKQGHQASVQDPRVQRTTQFQHLQPPRSLLFKTLSAQDNGSTHNLELSQVFRNISRCIQRSKLDGPKQTNPTCLFLGNVHLLIQPLESLCPVYYSLVKTSAASNLQVSKQATKQPVKQSRS
jgi:hypothetical protein